MGITRGRITACMRDDRHRRRRRRRIVVVGMVTLRAGDICDGANYAGTVGTRNIEFGS